MERRRFTTEFEREAVRQAQQAGVSRAKVAQELGLNANMLGRWVRQFSCAKWVCTPDKPLKSEQQLEIGRLRRELAKAQTERDIPKKSGGLLRQGTQLRYGFVARHQSIWPVRTMFRMLEVSRAGFYEWRARAPSVRSLEDARLGGLVRASFLASDRAYGSPRVWRDLHDWGERCAKKRCATDAHGVASGTPEVTPAADRRGLQARAHDCADCAGSAICSRASQPEVGRGLHPSVDS